MNNGIKTLIVSGGNSEEKLINEIYYRNNFDYIIASDKGLEALDKCKIKPNFIIGDFDSINKEILNKYIDDENIEIRELNPEKDYTDTHMAIKFAIELKSTSVTILGATGTRIDHALSNINVLKELLDNKIEGKIIDNKNEIQLMNCKKILKRDIEYKYISLIPLTTRVEGVTLKGFKYPLDNACLNIGESLGVSNEQIEDIGLIDIKKGILILIKARD